MRDRGEGVKNGPHLLDVIYSHHGEVQLRGLVLGSPRLVPLRLRLASLFYSLKVPSY